MKKSVNSILNEIKILSIVKSHFIVNLNFAFQDKEYLYMGMKEFSGGDLRYHLIKNKIFSENESKFMIACLIIGNKKYLIYNLQL